MRSLSMKPARLKFASLLRANRKICLETLESRQLMAVDVILEWNSVMLAANAADYDRTSPEQGGPINSSLAFAIVSGAMYDAYNSVERIGEPFMVTAKHGRGADSDAAVAQAAHDTLAALFPGQADAFDLALVQTLDRIADGTAENQGRRIGKEIAAKILAARAKDGSSSLTDSKYQASGLVGFHDVDPTHSGQGFYGAGIERVVPFVLRDLDAFAAPALDDGTAIGRLGFLQSEEYTQAYKEVLALGGDGNATATERTEEQSEIGIYWAYDGRPGIGTPPRLYNQIVRTIAEQEGNSEAENARLFALVNVAMADAGISAWQTKYAEDFWRPILGIRHGDLDGNAETVGDSDWTPLGAPASNPRPGESNFTPPFPAYVSGHATLGAAAFEMLENFYGRGNLTFSFTSDELNGVTLDADGSVRPIVERTFDSLTAAKEENAQSRIYLGIHWSFDADQGIAMGDSVADYVYRHAFQTKRDESTPHRKHRHNAFDPEDVNDDSNLSPLDALVLINHLNAQSSS